MFSNVAQMYEYALNPVKGWYALSALDKQAPLHPTLLASLTTVPAGRVMVLNSSGQFVLAGYTGTGGCAAPEHEMPIYMWQGSGDFDVSNLNTSPATGINHWVGCSPTGTMSGLVATGGYEIQTTEFDDDQDYACNDLLTVTTSADINEAGLLTNDSVTQYVTWICGICSSHTNWATEMPQYAAGGTYGAVKPSSGPVGHNAHRIAVLSFWSYFLPASASES